MKHRILLLLPALKEVLDRDFRQIKYSLFPPLSLLTLAALTPQDRYEVVVRDEHVEPVPIPGDFDLVAMTVYVSSAPRAYKLAERYREAGIKVIMGGIHPTTCPREALQHADAICIGPGEAVWPQILNDYDTDRLRPVYRGKIEGTAQRMPVPRRDLMNPDAYLVRNTMVTSLGCPHSCDFCYKASFWGEHFYEHRPIEMLERELESMTGGFVFILDDNFLSCRQKARRIFPLLRHSGMVWQAAGSLDIARDPEYLKEAYEAGCRSVFVGFESLSRANMEAEGKNVNAFSDYAQAVKRFHDAGLMINGSFVFGFDGDGPDVFDRTLEFAIENDIETGTFHILTPYPGTPTFARMQNAGRLLTTDWELYDTRHTVFRPAGMSPRELESGYHRAYREFYRYGSILKRSLGQPGALKRLAYNIGWKKSDWLWKHIIRLGLMSRIRPIFERILARPTQPHTSSDEIQDQKSPASSGQFADEAAIISAG